MISLAFTSKRYKYLLLLLWMYSPLCCAVVDALICILHLQLHVYSMSIAYYFNYISIVQMSVISNVCCVWEEKMRKEKRDELTAAQS